MLCHSVLIFDYSLALWGGGLLCSLFTGKLFRVPYLLTGGEFKVCQLIFKALIFWAITRRHLRVVLFALVAGSAMLEHLMVIFRHVALFFFDNALAFTLRNTPQMPVGLVSKLRMYRRLADCR